MQLLPLSQANNVMCC